jgi:hypothetical protein
MSARKTGPKFSGTKHIAQITSLPLRKSASSATHASRRAFPAWIVADESGVAFPATAVTPRVRSALVLRVVKQAKTSKPKGASDGRSAR